MEGQGVRHRVEDMQASFLALLADDGELGA